MIRTLAPNQIFVFGSNTRGAHGAGAALQATGESAAASATGDRLDEKGEFVECPA